jgi:hypothetical protein
MAQALQHNERLERARLQYENLYSKANSNTDDHERLNNGLDISADSLNISNNYINKTAISTSSKYTNNINKSFETPSSTRDLHLRGQSQRSQRESDTKNNLFSHQRENVNDSILWDEKSSIIIALQVLTGSI